MKQHSELYAIVCLLAQAVNMTSPLLHFAGKYQDFIGNPAEDPLRHLPSTWDETIVLPGSEIGKTVGFARRRGREWYIGLLRGGGNHRGLEPYFFTPTLICVNECAGKE